ncbi:hypothetical protein L6R52_37830, partial [Myxococcota bacterium]|nr:hypothetical protein [Myxococcota bacterium]
APVVGADEVARAPEPVRAPTISDRLLDVAHGAEPRLRKLITQAAHDLGRGDSGLAETSLKLALTFDPGHAVIRALLAEVVRLAPKDRRAPERISARERVLDQVTEREARGDVDGAIEVLDRALRTRKDAALYNRLGVLVATKKGDVARGRELLEKALELAPNNETYQHNLSKVLARAATLDLAKRGTSRVGGSEGLLGLFKKK